MMKSEAEIMLAVPICWKFESTNSRRVSRHLKRIPNFLSNFEIRVVLAPPAGRFSRRIPVQMFYKNIKKRLRPPAKPRYFCIRPGKQYIKSGSIARDSMNVVYLGALFGARTKSGDVGFKTAKLALSPCCDSVARKILPMQFSQRRRMTIADKPNLFHYLLYWQTIYLLCCCSRMTPQRLKNWCGPIDAPSLRR